MNLSTIEYIFEYEKVAKNISEGKRISRVFAEQVEVSSVLRAIRGVMYYLVEGQVWQRKHRASGKIDTVRDFCEIFSFPKNILPHRNPKI